MKNLFVIAAVLFAFSATSCKKDYTCECTGGIGVANYEINNQKKDDAETVCDTYKLVHDACSLKS